MYCTELLPIINSYLFVRMQYSYQLMNKNNYIKPGVCLGFKSKHREWSGTAKEISEQDIKIINKLDPYFW